jgi:hypothetical protein
MNVWYCLQLKNFLSSFHETGSNIRCWCDPSVTSVKRTPRCPTRSRTRVLRCLGSRLYLAHPKLLTSIALSLILGNRARNELLLARDVAIFHLTGYSDNQHQCIRKERSKPRVCECTPKHLLVCHLKGSPCPNRLTHLLGFTAVIQLWLL